MRRAFRVATAFTGAVACAAVFTPGTTAMAGTTSKARQMRPDDIIDCPTGYNTSVHLYWNTSEGHGPTCVGNYQTTYWQPDSAPRYKTLCPGNNSGVFYSVKSVGHLYTWGYGASRSRGSHAFDLHGNIASAIINSYWQGTSPKCDY